MQQENNNKHKENEENNLKKTLADSGYSSEVTAKIWQWYNPAKKKPQ